MEQINPVNVNVINNYTILNIDGKILNKRNTGEKEQGRKEENERTNNKLKNKPKVDRLYTCHKKSNSETCQKYE